MEQELLFQNRQKLMTKKALFLIINVYNGPEIHLFRPKEGKERKLRQSGGEVISLGVSYVTPRRRFFS